VGRSAGILKIQNYILDLVRNKGQITYGKLFYFNLFKLQDRLYKDTIYKT
jgi:hypothetical protein